MTYMDQLAKHKRKIFRKYPILEAKTNNQQLFELNVKGKHRYYFWDCLPIEHRTNQIWCLIRASLDHLNTLKQRGFRIFQLTFIPTQTLTQSIQQEIQILQHPEDSKAILITIPIHFDHLKVCDLSNSLNQFLR